MKVFSGSPAFAAFDRIRSADSTGDAPQRDRRQDQQSPPEEQAPDPEAEEKVFAAAIEFASESGITSHGLKPEVEGRGPGLRVVLKDGRGAIVRQFTGEEFLRMREAAAGGRGKLLDKKL